MNQRTWHRLKTSDAIAFASMVVALVSALTTIVQARLLDKERSTPYRAMIFNAQLDTFRQFSAAWRGWNDPVDEMPRKYLSIIIDGDYFKNPAVMRQVPRYSNYIQAVQMLGQEEDDTRKLLSTVSGAYSLWTGTTSDWLGKALNSLVERQYCLSNERQIYNLIGTAETDLSDDLINSFKNACLHHYSITDGLVMTEASMRNDLHANALQSIPSLKGID